jgi:hypothetical protein
MASSELDLNFKLGSLDYTINFFYKKVNWYLLDSFN